VLLQHLALISTVTTIDAAELAQVSGAIQKQVARDLAPLWGIAATVDVFPEFEDVPVGYWPIVIVDDAPQPGVHKDFNRQPIAYVVAGPTWSLAASHEVVEMLIDPWGDRIVAGDAPRGGERVEFLVEVCDPCQDPSHAYTVNGVLVSDFCTPAYFDPVGSNTVRYSYTGTISQPHQVLPGGYLTWHVPATRHWLQLRVTASGEAVHDLGPMQKGPLALRTMIDAQTPEKRELSRIPRSHPRVAEVMEAREHGLKMRLARAAEWRRLTAQVCGGGQ